MAVGNLRSSETLRRLRLVYFIIHGLFITLGLGLILIAGVTQKLDYDSLADLDKKATGPPQIVFYCAGGKGLDENVTLLAVHPDSCQLILIYRRNIKAFSSLLI